MSTPSSLPDGLPSPRQRSAFALLALVQSTLIFTIALITVPLPQIAAELQLSSAQLLLILAAYGLPFSGLLLFGGRLADRHGGRRMLVWGLCVFGLASVLAALAPGFLWLVAMRFAQGVGGALTAPAAIALLRALFPSPAGFGRAMATWGSVSVLGAVAGFIVSGVLTAWLPWRWMFAVPAAVALLGLLRMRHLPQGAAGQEGQRPGLDPLGAVLATLGISLASYGLIASADHGWRSAMSLAPLLTGLACLAVFLRVQRRVTDPLLPPGFVLDPCRMAGLGGMLLAAAGSGLINFVISLYLQQERGWSPLSTALGFVPFAVALLVAGRMAVDLVQRLGAARVTLGGLLLAAAGLGLLAGLERDSSYLLGMVPGMVLLAAGGALVFSGAAVLSTSHVPQHQAGLAGGVMNTAMELGPTVGLAVLMSVAATQADAVQGFSRAFAAAAVIHLLAAAGTWALLMRRPVAGGACQASH